MITTDTLQDPIFGKCINIKNDFVELRVATEFGPRIIHCSCIGMENMFYEDPDKEPLGDKFDEYNGDQLILYGGHRLWASPEIVPRCYHPDNEPVTVVMLENGARFTGAIEKHNQIQKSISVTLDAEFPRVKVVHTIRNLSMWDIQLAPWAITMMAPGGLEIMPMPDRESEYLPNRNFSLWDYTEFTDSRVYFGKNYLTLRQDPEMLNPFKIGYNNEVGWAAYFNRGQVFMKHFEPIQGGFYPDNGCCFETYTNGNMLEIETLGEMEELGPDDFVTLEEEWELFPAKCPDDPQNEELLADSINKL